MKTHTSQHRQLHQAIEPLEARIAPALITAVWLGGDGNWSDPSKWNIGVVPNNGGGNEYHVVLDVPGTATITLASSINIHSLSNAEHLNIVGSFYSPTYFHLTGGGVLTNTGTIQILSDGNDPNRSQIIFDDTTNVMGAGDMLLTNYPMLSGAPSAHVTLMGGQKIHGAGYVNIPLLDNAAFIDADVAGSFLSVTATGVNTNTLVASAGLLRLNNSHFDNTLGVLKSNGGTVEVTNSSLPGGDWLSTDNPASHIMLIGNVDADGANWKAPGAGDFQVNRTTTTLSGDVAFTGGKFALIGDYYTPMYFNYAGGTFTNNGTISITSDNNDPNRALFRLAADATLDGIGDVKLINTPLVTTGPGATLTLDKGQKLHGNGIVTGSYINNGTIEADSTAGPLLLSGPMINSADGTIGAHGGQLVLNNGTTITGGTLAVTDDSASVIDFVGTIGVDGTTWNGAGAGRFRLNYGTATLNGSVHLAAGQFDVLGSFGAPVYLNLGGGTWTNDGLIHLLSDNNDPNRSQIHLNDNVTLNGAGVLLIEHTPMISGAPGKQLTVSADQLIHGSGVINVPLLANAGTLTADAAGETLTVNSAGTNTKLMNATAGALRFDGANLTNTGATIRADGANVTLANCTITGGDIVATDNPASRVFFTGTVNADATTWRASGVGEFQVAYTTATLNGNIHLASGRFGLLGSFGAPMYLGLGGGTFTNDGRIELVSDQNDPNRAQIHLNANTIFDGMGEIKLIDAPLISGAPNTKLTLNAGQTLHGFGYVQLPRLDNAGTVASDVMNKALVLTSTGTNTGLMHASAGTLQINGSGFTNTGATVRADGGIVEFVNSTVTGGALVVTADAASRVRFVGNVNANGTTWTASGAGEFQVANTSTTLSGDVSLSSRKFSLLGSFGAPMYFHYAGGTFTNNGTIELISDNNDPNRGLFYVDANATLSGGGDLKMNGTPLLATAPAATLTIGMGQKIHGYGIITGNFTNLGTIQADAGANPLQLNAATITNTGGTVRASAGRVALNHGTTITGGTLAVTDDPASVIDFAGTIGVDGTTWSGAGAGRFRVPNTTATLNGSVHLAAGEFDVLGSFGAPTYLNLGSGTWTNDGLVRLVSDNNDPNRSQIHLNDNVTLDGSGVLQLEHTPMISGAPGTRLTVGVDQLVHGSGVVSVPLLTNAGTITADAAGEMLWVGSAGVNTNVFSAIAGTLRFDGANFTNTGATILADGANVSLVNSTISGGQIIATDNPASRVQLFGNVNADGTTWRAQGAGEFQVPNTTATLNGDVHLASGKFALIGNFYAPMLLNMGGGTFTNDGLIELVSDSQDANRGQLHLNASTTFAGTGDIKLIETPLISGAAGAKLTLGAGQVLHGFGYVTVSELDNAGIIASDVAGRALVVQGATTNSGELSAISGGTLNFTGSVVLTGAGVLSGDALGLITITGDLIGDTKNGSRIAGDPMACFEGPGQRQIEVMDHDLGWADAGFAGSYSFGTLTVNGASLQLQNVAANTNGAEALYVDDLTVPAGATLDLNGQRIYVRHSSTLEGTVIGDAGAPTSAVTAMPAFWLGDDLLVQWTGEDDAGGSGLAAFDIYVSDNGGAFTLWLDDTTATSARYTVQDGHTYAFYSAARDNIGYVEAAPVMADASTEVRFLAINSTPVVAVNEDAQYLYDAASNADGLGPVLTWSVVTAPSQLGLYMDTGVMNGSFDNAGVGDHTVTLRVDDDQGHHVTQTFTLDVANVAGTFATQTVPGALLGQPFSFNLDSTDEGTGGTHYSLLAGPAWLSVDANTGALSGTPSHAADLASTTVTARVDDNHGGLDERTFTLGVQGQVITLDPALRQTKATFTDANGDLVTVALTGKDGRVHLLRSIVPDGNGDYSNLTHADLSVIQLEGTTLKDGLTVTVKYDTKHKAGDKLTTLGELGGNGSLGKLTASTLDLTGAGLTLPNNTIVALKLHDLKNGADITLGGAEALKGVSFTAQKIETGSKLAFGSLLKMLKVWEWTNGELTAPKATTIQVTRTLDANLTLVGALSLLKAGTWSGALSAASLGKVSVIGDASADLELTNPLAKQALGSASISGSLMGAYWSVAGATGVITVAHDLDSTTLDLQAKVAAITVKGRARDSLVRSAGDITKLTLGASEHSDFGAGIALNELQSSRHAGDGSGPPTATIKSFTVSGLKVPKGQPIPRFFSDSFVSAKIGTMSVHNWDGLGGLWAPTGGIKKIMHHDTALKDAEHNWVFPEPPKQVSGQPELFVHIL